MFTNTTLNHENSSISMALFDCLKSVEKFSEAKIYKSERETRNGNVNACYFYSSGKIFRNQSHEVRFRKTS